MTRGYEIQRHHSYISMLISIVTTTNELSPLSFSPKVTYTRRARSRTRFSSNLSDWTGDRAVSRDGSHDGAGEDRARAPLVLLHNGSMFVDSMIPGRPSMTPAASFIAWRAWRELSDWWPAPACFFFVDGCFACACARRGHGRGRGRAASAPTTMGLGGKPRRQRTTGKDAKKKKKGERSAAVC